MKTRNDASDRAAQTALSILQTLLANHHPRNFTIRLWDGSVWPAESGEKSRFTMLIRQPGALRRMFLHPTERALGEVYIFDDIDIDGEMEAVFPMAEHLLRQSPGLRDRLRLGAKLLSLPRGRRTLAGRAAVELRGTRHSLERDRQAVTYHYNVSNDFFALYLGRRMVYSCGYFRKPTDTLETAQEQKLDYICRKLRLRSGERLLDIGCGWGGLLIFAAKKYGVSALGITLSEPQARLARERIAAHHLGTRCRVEVCDYRTISVAEPFDKIASIGMVEHVGAEKLPEYFGQAWRLLRPGGSFLNHGIAHPPGFGTTPAESFSHAYVFPDGDPGSINASTRVAEEAGFEVRDVESLREQYALTLRHWIRRLERRRTEAIRLTDEPTYRTWRLYMSASAHGFQTGQYNVYQSLLVKPDEGKSGLPLTREDWYTAGRS